jgi:Prokaryotic N-terminal methylation motif
MTGRAAGFTLIELLLAMTMTAMVMVSAMVAVNLFSTADRAAINGYELDVEVQRALRLMVDDTTQAVSITTGVRSLKFELADGRFVTWLRPPGDQELIRVTGDSLLAVEAAASLALVSLGSLEYDARGRLRDGSYRESAALQGQHVFDLQLVTSRRNRVVVGVQVRITTDAGETRTHRAITACSARLLEANCKPPV